MGGVQTNSVDHRAAAIVLEGGPSSTATYFTDYGRVYQAPALLSQVRKREKVEAKSLVASLQR
jgi:hypothetical protein